MRSRLPVACCLLPVACFFPLEVRAEQTLFRPSERCMACHNGVSSPKTGEDISFGFDWRPSIMANAARDPYWQASVRREVIDRPGARALIEDECSPCHMPMPTFQARARGGHGQIFSVIAAERRSEPAERLGLDGVSCSVCHQIEDRDLGSPASFTGNYRIDTRRRWTDRRIFGPWTIDDGRTRVMESATELLPQRADHLAKAELCAPCHTLYTEARDWNGKVIGRLPEQVPYLEWKHSDYYRRQQTCQDCHMPRVSGEPNITNVFGEPHERFFRHVFRGANFFMQRVLAANSADLQVAALPQELESALRWDTGQLQSLTARLGLRAELRGNELVATVSVRNLAGHKIPTAYPARRMWLRFAVRGPDGALLFESGGLGPRGNIRGNANDEDARRFEPHYQEITRGDQVQIYESIMGDPQGLATTGLLTGVRYLKDNRLLPRGFDKARAHADVAVHGEAARDADFVAGGDRLRYRVRLPRQTGPSRAEAGPLRVEVELWYQPIGYRWAENLSSPAYRSEQADRFVRAIEPLRGASALRIARAASSVQR
jgi:hypothetical protein